MKRTGLLSAVLLLAAGLTACTNKQGTTEAPVFITVNLSLQPGFVNIQDAAPVQIQTINLASHLKSAAASDPQGFATTQVNSYLVHFRRTDGGTRVPPDKTFACGITVAAGASATLSNFPILSAADTQESPFDQLLPFNGGIDRETNKNEIHMAFDITFFGMTAAGQRVQSETASGILIFQFAGGTPLSRFSGS
jgi:hypothetical protein